MATEVTEIDGSLLEGGGQILRMALAMSTLCKMPVRIINIRSGRSKPGLMEQHLKGVELVRDMCNAKVKGATLGSTTVEFFPGHINGGHYKAIVKTAGSISLLLQVALPCALFASSETVLSLQGGTNAEMAPQIDYTTEVFRPLIEKFGATFHFELINRGYFPKGGGEITVTIKPVGSLKAVELLNQGDITSVYGWSFVAGSLPMHLAHTMANNAANMLKRIHSNIDIERYKENANVAIGNCSGIVLVAETNTECIFGGSALGKRSETPDQTGSKAAEEIINSVNEGACVDEHCQDQIILYMALADGLSKIKTGQITMHTKTAIYVAERMTNAKFEIVSKDGCSIIECNGIALKT